MGNIKVWFEQGVVWKPARPLARGFRLVVKAAEQDVFVTSGAEGDHHPASLHYCGLAWDMRACGFTKETLLKALPGGDKYWDVVKYVWGFHIEFDPKI